MQGKPGPVTDIDAHESHARTAIADGDDAMERWPRPLRVLFILAAALACWAVPLTILYRYFAG